VCLFRFSIFHIFVLAQIILLSTHADRQGVDISFTVCVFFVCLFVVCLFVCTVTDFCTKDKASGVKFCTGFIGVQGS